jgi:acetylornithine deacetylase/succinyl-diaminopimelate desuccinylase family protein
MAAKVMGVVELAEKLVIINSEIPVSGEPQRDVEKSIAEFIKGYLEGIGIIPEIIEIEKGRYDLIAKVGPSDRLMLNGHMDTVPIGDPTQWIYGVSPKIQDGKLYGRGSSDMKGGLAAILDSLSRIDFTNAKRGILIAFVADEEGFFKGSEWLFANRKDIFDDVKGGIIAEATSMRIQAAQKGLIGIQVTFAGRSAHASTPEKGDSAILKAFKFISAMNSFNESRGTTDSLLNKGSLNIGEIHGGRSQNTVPDSCMVSVDIRTVPGEASETIIKEIKKAIEAQGIKDTDIKEMKINYAREPFKLNNDSSALRLLKKAAGTSALIGGTGYTESELYHSKVGVDCVVFGPGIKDLIHQPNEYVNVQDLKEASKIFEKAIREWCFGNEEIV